MSHVSVRDRRSTSSTRASRNTRAEAESRAQGLSIGWTVVSYLLSGMAAYGGIGWLIGHAVHVEMLFPVGMLVGLAISIGFVIWRYGRSPDRVSMYEDNNMDKGMSAAASRRASHRRGIPREEKSR